MVDRHGWLLFALVWISRCVVAGVFVAAAIPKLVDLPAFAADISNYRAFPSWSSNLLAAIVPMIELVGAACVLTGWKRRGAAWMLGLLTVGFIALIGSVIARGIDIGCGCFGADESAASVGWPTLVRDLALLVAIALTALPVRVRRPE